MYINHIIMIIHSKKSSLQYVPSFFNEIGSKSCIYSKTHSNSPAHLFTSILGQAAYSIFRQSAYEYDFIYYISFIFTVSYFQVLQIQVRIHLNNVDSSAITTTIHTMQPIQVFYYCNSSINYTFSLVLVKGYWFITKFM